MNIAINNSINFNAKLDYSGMRSNKARWARVAKIFEKKTANSPKETFYIYNEICDEKDVFHFDYSLPPDRKRIVRNEGWIQPEIGDIFKKLSDNELAKYLKKLFIVLKKTEKVEESAFNFREKFNLDKIPPSELDDKFWHTILDIKESYLNMLLKDDPILSKEEAVCIP